MQRITVVRALAGLAVVVALAMVAITSKHTVPPVYAGSGCSAATLNGNYAVMQPAGFTANGNNTTGGEVPWQFVGVAYFDGHGNMAATYTATVNGAISFNNMDTGTYTLTAGNVLQSLISSAPSECVGSITFGNGGSAPGYTANIATVNGGAEIFGIYAPVSGGGTATFDLKKQ